MQTSHKFKEGDLVHHVDPRTDCYKWHGTVCWVDPGGKFCDVIWNEAQAGYERKHPYKDRTYMAPRDPARYPVSLLELLF